MKPVLIYDGDCDFCRYWVGRWQSRTGDAVDYRSSHEVPENYSDIPAENFGQAVQFVDEQGRIFSGAGAVFRCLAHGRGWQWAAMSNLRVPGFALLTETAYDFFAGHRRFSTFFTKALWGLRYEPPQFFLARWLFLRNLGSIFLVAFLSLYVQLDGLIGENGILPASQLNELAIDQIGNARYWQLPTLYWLHPSDGFLHALCLVGIAASLFVVAGIVPPISVFVSWIAYLSLLNVGRDFLSFQWDTLLVETAFLAIFLAPLQVLPRWSREARPVPFVLLLQWWLLFRLTFASGFVKLNDATWRHLEALNVHYETQPLPTVLGWYVHQMPESFHRLSVVLMFVIELVVPFLIIFPRRIRHTGAVVLIAFQGLIILTGNYTYFNWLAIVLCLLLFDDQAIRAVLKRFRWLPGSPRAALRPVSPYRWALASVMGGVMLFLSVTAFGVQLTRSDRIPKAVLKPLYTVQPFRLVNTYGLFAHMTTSRAEIIVEGSNDALEWKAYRFKWKAGDLDRSPGRVAPFQPRLDWQMWFAALGSSRSTPWFSNFVIRLLQGSPEVLALLEEDPFPEGPPLYIRARLFDYRFTTLDERRETGNWWRREYLRDYLPAVRLPPEY